jgi:hypothetical protein
LSINQKEVTKALISRGDQPGRRTYQPSEVGVVNQPEGVNKPLVSTKGISSGGGLISKRNGELTSRRDLISPRSARRG